MAAAKGADNMEALELSSTQPTTLSAFVLQTILWMDKFIGSV